MQARATRRATPLVSDSEPQSAVRPWRLGRMLGAYVVRELTFPTLLSLVGLTLLAIAADLVDLLGSRSSTGASASGEVAAIALFRSVPMLGRAIPFSVLLGALSRSGAWGPTARSWRSRRAASRHAGSSAPVLLLRRDSSRRSASASRPVRRAVGESQPRRSRSRPARAQAPAPCCEAAWSAAIGDWRIQAQEVSSPGDQLRGVALWVPIDRRDRLRAERRSRARERVAKQHPDRERVPCCATPTTVRPTSASTACRQADAPTTPRRHAAATGSRPASLSRSRARDPLSRRKTRAARRRRSGTGASPCPRPRVACSGSSRCRSPCARTPSLALGGRRARASGRSLVYFALLQLSNSARAHSDGSRCRVAVWVPESRAGRRRDRAARAVASRVAQRP